MSVSFSVMRRVLRYFLRISLRFCIPVLREGEMFFFGKINQVPGGRTRYLVLDDILNEGEKNRGEFSR